MTDAEYLKLRTILKRIETKVDLLIYKKQHTDGQTRETDGSMSEFAFADEQACGCSRKTYYDDLIAEEKETLSPRKKRSYPHE